MQEFGSLAHKTQYNTIVAANGAAHCWTLERMQAKFIQLIPNIRSNVWLSSRGTINNIYDTSSQTCSVHYIIYCNYKLQPGNHMHFVHAQQHPF